MTSLPRPRVALAFGLAALTLSVSACGSDADSAQKRAQARVTVKERDAVEARSAFDEASDEFCSSAKDYITSLDRYGDLLHATATTVGDVKEAGSDLAAPRRDALDSAQAAVEAHDALTQAEQELAEAQAALKEAKASTSTSPKASASASPTPSSSPVVPNATVQRVTQAEQDFADAQRGITDETPLAKAAETFNAAAVALEVSWLRLFTDAGCLGEDQKQAVQAVSDYTKALQQSLAEAGYYDGAVDGVYSSATTKAVEALQKAHNLPVTGTVDKATAAALQGDLAAKGGVAAQQATAETAAIQQTLALAGYWDGPVDGTWTPALTDAIKKLQSDLGVEPTGTVNAATVDAFEKAVAKALAPEPTPSATPTPSETPSPSSS